MAIRITTKECIQNVIKIQKPKLVITLFNTLFPYYVTLKWEDTTDNNWQSFKYHLYAHPLIPKNFRGNEIKRVERTANKSRLHHCHQWAHCSFPG
jgi:hypothetical protein